MEDKIGQEIWESGIVKVMPSTSLHGNGDHQELNKDNMEEHLNPVLKRYVKLLRELKIQYFLSLNLLRTIKISFS